MPVNPITGQSDYRDMLAQQLLMGGAQTPRNVGEGLSSVGKSLAGALIARQSQDRQEAEAATYNAGLAKLLEASGGGRESMLSALGEIDNPRLQQSLAPQLLGQTLEGAEYDRRQGIQHQNQLDLLAAKRPSFQTVQNPYGRGGVGQLDATTGQISGYQGPQQAPQETYGDPVAVTSPDGTQSFVRFGNRGGQIPLDGGLTPTPDRGDINKFENNLRDDFNAVTKDYRAIEDAYSRIRASAKDPSAAGDMALIFNYMKLLDPGSVVRESEFQLAGDAGSLPDRVQGAFNRVRSGQRLSDKQRNDFVDRSKGLYRAQYDNYSSYADQYSSMAERMGLNPENVIVRLPEAVDLEDDTSPSPDKPLTPEEIKERNQLRKELGLE